MTDPGDPSSVGRARRHAAAWIGPIVVAGAGAAMAVWTWGTWPDIVIDFGRELYVPWRITQGEALYRDIAYFNGPLSPSINAVWFRVFGVGLRTLVVANLAILGLIVWMMFRLLERATDRFGATAGCLAFLTVFAFSQYNLNGNANYVCPYSHEISHGLALGLAGVTCAQRYGRSGALRWALVTGILVGMAFLTKAEFFVAALGSSSAAVSAAVRTRRSSLGHGAKCWMAFVAGLMVPPALAFVLLTRHMDVDVALRGLVGSWPWVLGSDAPTMRFFQVMGGWDDIGASLLSMTVWCGAYALVIIAAAGAAIATSRLRTRPALVSMVVFVGATAALAWAAFPGGGGEALAKTPQTSPIWSGFLRPLPVAMLGCAVIYLRRIRTQTGPSDREQCVAGIGLAALASLLLVKMLLNAHVEGYGFAHAAVATVVVIAVASSVLPAWVAARGGAAGVMRAVAAACLVIVIATHLRIAGYWEGSKTHRVAAGADAFRANPRAMIVNSAVAALQNLIPADGTVAVFPEGVMLNYLARRATSVPYVNFIPPELAIFGEGRMAAALQDHPPDYVLIVTRLTREYGPTFFGQDYGERLYEWISANYTPIRTIGGNPLSERRFGVLIARRSDVGGPSR